MRIMKPIAMTCAISLLMLGYLASAFAAATFSVIASGDTTGTTDHANIAAAFADAQAAGDGSTVQLGAGTFYIRKPIQVANFVGTLQGAGKEMTFITNPLGRGIANADPPAPPGGHPLIFYQDALWPEGTVQDIALKDFTVGVDELPIPWGTVIAGVLNVRSFSNLINHDGRITGTGDSSEVAHINFTFDSVGLEGFGISDFGIQSGNIFNFEEMGSIEIEYKGETLLVRAIAGYGAPWKKVSGELLVRNGSFNDLLGPAVDLFRNLQGFYALIENNTTSNTSLVGAENWSPWTPLTLVVSGNEINQGPDNWYAGIETWGNGINLLIEANTISGDGFVPIAAAASTNINISNNFVTGNWVFGINPWLGSNGCTITGNLLGETKDGQQPGMSSLFGAISIEESNNCTVSGNKFVNVSSPLLGAVWVSGQFNRVENNDYTESGLPGWNVGPGAIMLARFMGATFDRGSIKNHVLETQYPAGTDVCDQVQGIQGNNVQALIGGGVVEVNPGMCASVLTLEVFNESSTGLLQQMAEMQK